MGQDLRVRLGGLLCVALGTVAAWFFVMLPLQQARAGAPEIEMHLKGAFVLVPLMLVWGSAFLVGGENARYRDVTRNPPTFTLLGWVLLGLSLVAAGAFWWWVEAQLAALGYR